MAMLVAPSQSELNVEQINNIFNVLIINSYRIDDTYYGKCIWDIIAIRYDNDVLEKWFQSTLDCTCCKRHASRRPITIGCSFNSPDCRHPVKKICKCHCRHLSRTIQRGYFIRNKLK